MKNTLDLTIQYSASNNLLLEATLEGLSELAGILEDNSEKTQCKLLVPAEAVAKSYEGFLTDLHIVKSDGALKIYHNPSVLMISGSPSNCSILAANLNFLQEEALSQPQLQSVLHWHIDYFPGHFYLDPVSEPAVVYIKTVRQEAGLTL